SISARSRSSLISTTSPHRLTWRYQSSSNTVRLTLGSRRIHRRRFRDSFMLTKTRPFSQSYQVTTVIGNPSGRTTPMTAAFGFFRKASTCAGSSSTGTVLLQGEGRLPPVGQIVELDRNDPLDPPEPASIRRDQARRASVTRIQWGVAKARREQPGGGFHRGKPAVIARARDDTDDRPVRAGEEP